MKTIAAFVLTLFVATAAFARIGGGDSYSGSSSDSSSSSSSSSSDWSSSSDSDYGSSSSSSSSGGGSSSSSSGDIVYVLAAFFFIFVFGAIGGKLNTGVRSITLAPSTVRRDESSSNALAPLRQYDANFSEIVFADFCYSLFARVYEASGRGRVDNFAPYLSAEVRAKLKQSAPAGLKSIDAVVIGSFAVVAVRGLDTPHVEADVEFEANFSEVTDTTRRWYVKEQWTLTRLRDLLSPAPVHARAEHCPKCGAALETRSDGACLHCGSVITDGTFHWFVVAIVPKERHERAPQLGGSTGPEPGLDRRTQYAPWIARKMSTFATAHAGFSWEDFERRVRQVAAELQNAWTSRDWKRARPFEIDALFQMHRYWIDEYTRQKMRNIVDEYTIDKVDVVNVTSDAFYDAITVRLYASGNDYTEDENGAIVGGMKHTRKAWSEYWTFVRGRLPVPAGARVCPNCGAERAEGPAAICDYCGGKITTGEFPWVLSRIEQDEAYRG